jgi:hypothetical protein
MSWLQYYSLCVLPAYVENWRHSICIQKRQEREYGTGAALESQGLIHPEWISLRMIWIEEFTSTHAFKRTRVWKKLAIGL